MPKAEYTAATTIHQTIQTPQNEQNQPLPEPSFTGKLKDIFSNERILNGLMSRDKSIIRFIYKNHFQQIRHLILSNSGTPMDAEDVFQDALLIIYQKIMKGGMELTCSFSTYLYAICKNVWLTRLEHKGKQPEPRDLSGYELPAEQLNIEAILAENDQHKLFRHHFEKLDEKERKVLSLYLKKVPLAEIANIMGYKSAAYAKVRKYLTKEKLKNSILNDPHYRELEQKRELSVIFQS